MIVGASDSRSEALGLAKRANELLREDGYRKEEQKPLFGIEKSYGKWLVQSEDIDPSEIVAIAPSLLPFFPDFIILQGYGGKKISSGNPAVAVNDEKKREKPNRSRRFQWLFLIALAGAGLVAIFWGTRVIFRIKEEQDQLEESQKELLNEMRKGERNV
jgi:hypothetical protein